MNRWEPYADEKAWWQGQLESHVNEPVEPDDIPLDFLRAAGDDDSYECWDCGCEVREDDLDPATGVCVRCAAKDEIDYGWEMPAFRPSRWARKW